MGLRLPEIIATMVFFTFFSVPAIIAACFIAKKAGYPWALGLLAAIPLVNLIIPIVFAFVEWPVLRELRSLSAQHGPTGGERSGSLMVR